MRRPVVLAVLLALAAAPHTARADEIVVLHGTDDPVAVETAEREDDLGFDAERRFTRAVRGFAADLTPAQAAELAADPEVAAVVPDRPVRASGFVPAQGTVPPGVSRVLDTPATHVREAATGAVAVVDTGIDLGHPDLVAQRGVNCTDDSSIEDDHGHGTHVAGTIAARNDRRGVTGVAPGTTVIAVKVLDDEGNGRASNVICGIEWILANREARGIVAANFSLGGPGSPTNCNPAVGDPEHVAFCRLAAAGVTPVVAAGNDGVDFAGRDGEVPAAFPQVLTVAAMADTDGRPGALGAPTACEEVDTPDDRYAAFSNFATTAAAERHLVAAPGVCVLSTVPDGYGWSSGTSMASPHVAGLVALCHGEAGEPGPCTGLTVPQIIARMRAAEDGYLFSTPPGRLFGPLAMLSDPTTPTPVVEEPAGAAGDGDRAAAAAPPAAPAPAPAPPPILAAPPVQAPTADEERGAAPTLSIARTTLAGLRRRGLRLRLRCPRACAGTVRLRVSQRAARRMRLRGTTTLAARHVTHDGTVRLRLTREARRGLRRIRRFRAALSVTLRTSTGDVRLTRRLRAG